MECFRIWLGNFRFSQSNVVDKHGCFGNLTSTWISDTTTRPIFFLWESSLFRDKVSIFEGKNRFGKFWIWKGEMVLFVTTQQKKEHSIGVWWRWRHKHTLRFCLSWTWFDFEFSKFEKMVLFSLKITFLYFHRFLIAAYLLVLNGYANVFHLEEDSTNCSRRVNLLLTLCL